MFGDKGIEQCTCFFFTHDSHGTMKRTADAVGSATTTAFRHGFDKFIMPTAVADGLGAVVRDGGLSKDR